MASADRPVLFAEAKFLRMTALAVFAVTGGALGGGARTLDAVRAASEWTTGTKVPRVCSFKAETGYSCMGCGGTRAFVEASRGDLARGARLNALGAWVAASAWLLALASGLTALTGLRRPLLWALGIVLVSLPLAFLWRAVSWWMSLPAGLFLPR